MPTPVWTAIADAYIAIDMFQTAFLNRLFRDNADHLKGVIDGAADAPKVPAQIFATQSSGNGLGLVAKQWNHLLYTVPPTVVGAASTVELDTDVFADAYRFAGIAVKVTAGANYAVSAKIVTQPGGAAGKAYLSLTNGGAGAATVEGSVLFLLLVAP